LFYRLRPGLDAFPTDAENLGIIRDEVTRHGGAVAHAQVIELVPFFEKGLFLPVAGPRLIPAQTARERSAKVGTDDQFARLNLHRQVMAKDLAKKERLPHDQRLTPKFGGELDRGRGGAEVTAKPRLKE
jgi:hypothetical protein